MLLLSPKEASRVGHNELDVVGMSELAHSQLVVQAGVGQNNHLQGGGEYSW